MIKLLKKRLYSIRMVAAIFDIGLHVHAFLHRYGAHTITIINVHYNNLRNAYRS